LYKFKRYDSVEKAVIMEMFYAKETSSHYFSFEFFSLFRIAYYVERFDRQLSTLFSSNTCIHVYVYILCCPLIFIYFFHC
jgi:hypothetical protein